ncbi:MAG: 50S ribosomal protein L24 [Cocleimonas sp.]
MNKIVKNDQVVVIAGKDKGRMGSVTQVLTNGKLLIQGMNIAKKHQKGNPQAGIPGGIIDKEMPVDASNVMLVNPTTNKGDRVGIKVLENGDKVRFFKSNGETVS